MIRSAFIAIAMLSATAATPAFAGIGGSATTSNFGQIGAFYGQIGAFFGQIGAFYGQIGAF